MAVGQFRIVEETLFFMIGIIIVSIVIYSFNTIEADLKNVSMEDQLRGVAEEVEDGIVKVVGFDNAYLKVEIPKKICERFYVVKLSGDNLIVYDYENPRMNVTEKIFGLGYMKSSDGYVYSTAGYIVINSSSNKITIGR
ncbi:MAG: hypothetical protein J7L43_02205 [Candidatus Aenigmarchaeota archaeon]|nr:hypothetical protein [Candidatus Aenigmarchaeota archaeon]